MQISGWMYLLEQTMSSVCLLLAMGLCAGLPRCAPLRLALTGLLCAVVSAASLPLPGVLRLMLLVTVSAAAPLTAWPGVPRRLTLRLMLLGLMLPLWLTGVMRLMQGAGLWGPVAVLLGCLALRALPGLTTRTGPAPPCTSVELRHGGRRLTLTALVDSGNLLRDSVTGLPVIVISRRAASRLMPLPPEGMLLPGMRLLSVRTISGAALMTVFRPEGVSILRAGRWQAVQTLVGLGPEGYEGFQALVPSLLLQEAPPAPHSSTLSQGG